MQNYTNTDNSRCVTMTFGLQQQQDTKCPASIQFDQWGHAQSSAVSLPNHTFIGQA